MVTVSPRPGVCLPSIREVEEAQAEAETHKNNQSKTLLSLQDFEKLLDVVSLQQSELISRLSAIKDNLKASHALPPLASPRKLSEKQEKEAIEDDQSYMWGLEIVGHMPYPICKGKYFLVEVRTVSLTGEELPRDEDVELEIVLLSSEDSPVEIRENMAGKPIFRGQASTLLKYDAKENYHSASFKVQITEVSSHFVNGWVRLVIRPKKGAFPGSPPSLIEPLSVTNVIVRAKEKTCRKFRERERRGIPQQRVKNLRTASCKASFQESESN